jgi:hypothetical protein
MSDYRVKLEVAGPAAMLTRSGHEEAPSVSGQPIKIYNRRRRLG